MLIKLVGIVAVQDQDGGLRHLTGAQAQVAFARLVLDRPGGTGRGELADTVWPGELPDTWSSALRGVVSRLRAFLSRSAGVHEPLVARDGRYLLSLPPGARVDVEEAGSDLAAAERALRDGSPADALRLATSAIEVLAQTFLPDHDGEWVGDRREVFGTMFVGALEAASEAAARLGDGRTALAHAERAVRHSPLRESAHRARMSAHVAAGNHAEALRSYELLRRMLVDELGTDPGPETRAAYAELLEPRPATPEPPLVDATERCVWRRTELEALERSWTEVDAGARRVVLLEGEPGSGRTHLLAEFAARRARDGALVLHGCCGGGSTVPYQPLVQALAGLAADGSDRTGLSPAARSTLTRLATEPGDRLARLVPVQQGELFLALTELFLAVARTGAVAVVLDDLDQADDGTIGLLGNVLRRCSGAGARLLVVAAVGPSWSTGGVRLAEGEPDYGFVRLPLRGLDETDARRLTEHLVPDATDAPAPHRLVALTGGNALLVQALLRDHRDGGTGRGAGRRIAPEVARYATRRLAELEPAPRYLLQAAALIGPSFELDIVARAVRLNTAEALDALDVLLSAGLVADDGAIGPGRTTRRYRLTHEVLRPALREQSEHGRRRDLHTRLADAIEHLRADDLDTYARTLARHRTRAASADGDARAVRASWRAAAVATRDGATRESVQHYLRALEHVSVGGDALRCDALTRLGLAQAADDDPACAATLLDATLLALQVRRTGIAVQAALGLATATQRHPALRGEAAALVEELATTGAATADPAHRIDGVPLGRLLAYGARLGRVPGDLRGADGALTAMLAELDLVTCPTMLHWRQTLAADTLELAVAAGMGAAQLQAVHHLTSTAGLRGDVRTSERGIARLTEVMAEEGGPEERTWLVEHAVATAVTEGRFTDAAVLARSVPPGSPGSPIDRQMTVARWLRDGTSETGEVSSPVALQAPAAPPVCPLTTLLAGQRSAAHVQVRAHAIGAAPLPEGDERLHTLGVLALCAVELADPGTAAAVRSLLLPFADLTCGVGYRTFIGPVAFHLGRLALVIGDWDEAERYLAAAMPSLTERQARPWIALAQQDLARALDARAAPGDRWCARALRAEASWALASLGVRRPA